MAGQDRTSEQRVSTQSAPPISSAADARTTLTAMLQRKGIDEVKFWNHLLPVLQHLIDGETPSAEISYRNGQIMLSTGSPIASP